MNLDGNFRASQAFARKLRRAGKPGAIVNISSAAGIMAVPNRLGYVASRFGVSGITRAMAMELAALGIRVNAIAPGMIRTPMTDGMFQDPENEKRIRAAHPIEREGAPEVNGRRWSLLPAESHYWRGEQYKRLWRQTRRTSSCTGHFSWRNSSTNY